MNNLRAHQIVLPTIRFESRDIPPAVRDALHQYSVPKSIPLTARVSINMCYFLLLLLHVLACIGHHQAGYLQRNTCLTNTIQELVRLNTIQLN
jgi:hypothetical protein